MKRRWKDNRIKEEQERRGKGVLYDKSLKKCSSLLLTKEKYTSEPLEQPPFIVHGQESLVEEQHCLVSEIDSSKLLY